jgi:hypothetical protein
MNPPPDPLPDTDSINQRALAAVRSYRITVRVLAISAFAFALLAVAISLYLVWFWRTTFVPKHEELLQGTDWLRQAAAGGAANAPGGSSAAGTNLLERIGGMMKVEAAHTYALSMGVALVALLDSALGLGILALATVVMLNRRVTLKQINAHLAQISQQLRELQQRPGSP